MRVFQVFGCFSSDLADWHCLCQLRALLLVTWIANTSQEPWITGEIREGKAALVEAGPVLARKHRNVMQIPCAEGRTQTNAFYPTGHGASRLVGSFKAVHLF